jgi:hypothetical protein
VYSYPNADTYQGISFFQSRNLTGTDYTCTIVGNSGLDLQGALYFPTVPMDLSGTTDSLGNMLVADTLWVHGDGTLTINCYDGPFTTPGHTVFLVPEPDPPQR